MRLESILRKTQAELKVALISELKSRHYPTKVMKGFIYARGSIPVLLVAHLDTVHRSPVSNICSTSDGNILMSPEGIGGDDRAGVYMILQLIQKYPCHVLFCEDEEIGGLGATAFKRSKIKPKVNYIVELDRKGANDAVFYSCDNPEFTEFVCSFGFVEDFGSFSDISIVAPALGVAAVNISCGYYDAHTRYETINLAQMRKNIQRVGQMIASPGKFFEFIDSDFPTWTSIAPAPPHSFVRSPTGGMIEGGDKLYVDSRGTPYEYDEELGVAVALRGYSAISANSLPVRYDSRLSQTVEVVPLDYF